MKTLVINWHLTEVCNYRCQYCFAHWEKAGKEIFHHLDLVQKLLTEIQKLPTLLASDFSGIRLNFVGGEPTLYPKKIFKIIGLAKNLGFDLSMVSNGSLLDDAWLALIAKDFSGLGLSIDTLDFDRNKQIGRVSKNQSMNLANWLQIVEKLRQSKSNFYIKINTVVNQINWQEDLSPLIDAVKPNKWKIFKMLPIGTTQLSINDAQFQFFLRQHQRFQNIIFAENNDEMTNSYFMIDPYGRIFQNHESHQYQYSESIVQFGIEHALQQTSFSLEKYRQRY